MNETRTWEPTKLVAVRARTHPAACAGDPRRDRHGRSVFGRGGGGRDGACYRWLVSRVSVPPLSALAYSLPPNLLRFHSTCDRIPRR
jgi:hypothetical protein